MTYSEIQTRIKNYLNRSDLTSQIQDFIHFGQRKIEKVARWNGNKNRATISTSDHYITVPARLIEVINFSVTENDREYPLKKCTEDEIKKIHTDLTNDTGRPVYFAIVESLSEFLVRPTPDQTYTFDISYYRYGAELSDNNTTNWITNNHPELLIYMALLEAEPYIMNDERVQVWANMAATLMEDLVGEENRRALSPNMTFYAA